MDMISDLSQLMIGGSLCLIGGVFVIEGSLTIIGYAVLAPLAIGGLGLCLSSLRKIISTLPLSGGLNAK